MNRNGPRPKPCPYCGTSMECDEVDVGVGYIQCGPYYCFECGASEIGPELKEVEADLNEDEKRTGFYKNRISPYANQTIDGTLVDHKTAKKLYEMGLLKEKP